MGLVRTSIWVPALWTCAKLLILAAAAGGNPHDPLNPDASETNERRQKHC